MSKIRDIGEFGLINRLAEIFKFDKGIYRSIGDDCAVIKSGRRYLLFTIDALIENIHFDRRYTPPAHLGYKSLAVSLSDIAAMAGDPKGAVVSLAVPPDLELVFILEFAKGMRRCASEYRCPIIGGDISKSTDSIFINTAVIGESLSKPIMRNGARDGDLIAVAGVIGESKAGMMLLQAELKKGKIHSNNPIYRRKFVRSHLKPKPLIEEASRLAKLLKLNSMIDIPDGLSSELNHIAEQSKVKIIIEKNKIPIGKGLKKFCADNRLEAWEFVVKGGEDYALLFSFPKRNYHKLKNYKLKTPITVIGFIEKGEGVYIKDRQEEKILHPNSFTHF